MTGADERRWGFTLVGGVVVLVAVAALLEALRRAVGEVDVAAGRAWTEGKRLAQNTQVAHLLATTAERAAALRDAGERRAD